MIRIVSSIAIMSSHLPKKIETIRNVYLEDNLFYIFLNYFSTLMTAAYIKELISVYNKQMRESHKNKIVVVFDLSRYPNM